MKTAWHSPQNSHASPTPLVDGSHIFVHFGHQGTACVSTGGEIVWKNQSLKYPPVHGNGGSPILVDGVLIFSCDGGSDPFVVGLDADSGQVKWKYDRPTDSVKKFAFSTAEVIVVDGKKQVISPGAGMVNSLDPASGKEIWRVTYDGYSVIPKPVFGNGLVYLSTGYDSPTIIAIRPDGRGDVTETHVVWTLEKGAPHTPSPLLIGQELYLVSDRGTASCVDALTGETIWQGGLRGLPASPLFRREDLPRERGGSAPSASRGGHSRSWPRWLSEQTPVVCRRGRGIFVRTEKGLYRSRKRVRAADMVSEQPKIWAAVRLMRPIALEPLSSWLKSRGSAMFSSTAIARSE
jgi:outer membrane protein assembly factor BamB